MVSKNLNEALKDCLQDDHKVSLYEAKVIHQMIMADGVMSSEERAFLEAALQKNKFDDKAYELLSQLILRTE